MAVALVLGLTAHGHAQSGVGYEVPLSWCPVPDAVGYVVGVAFAPLVEGQYWITTRRLAIQASDTVTVRLIGRLRYYVAVQAVSADGVPGAWSEALCVTEGGPACPVTAPLPDQCEGDDRPGRPRNLRRTE